MSKLFPGGVGRSSQQVVDRSGESVRRVFPDSSSVISRFVANLTPVPQSGDAVNRAFSQKD